MTSRYLLGPKGWLVRAFLGTAAVNVANIALSLIGSVIAARALSPSGRGELFEVMLWSTVILAYGMMALPTSIAITTAQRSEGSHALASALTAASALSVLVLALHSLALPWLVNSELRREALLFGVVVIPSSIIGQSLLALDQGASRMRKLNVVRLMPNSLYAIGSALLWALDWGTVASFAAVHAAGSAGVVLYKLWDVRRSMFTRPLLPHIGRLFAVGASIHAGVLISITFARLDQMYVAAKLTQHDKGLYAVATTAGCVGFGILASAVQTAYLPLFAAIRDPAMWVSRFRRLMVATFAASIALCALAVILSPALLSLLFGPEFQGAALLSILIALSQVPTTFVAIACALLRTRGDWLTGILAPASGLAAIAVCLGSLMNSLSLAVIGAGLVLAHCVSLACVVWRISASLRLPVTACLLPDREDLKAIGRCAHLLFVSRAIRLKMRPHMR